MPELPEVENVVRKLRDKVIGKKIEDIELRYTGIIGQAKLKYYNERGQWSHDVYKNNDPKLFIETLRKKKIKDLRRKGKYIIFELPGGILVNHLRMTGNLIYTAELENNPLVDDPHTHAIFKLTEGYIIYNDIRKFGRFYWVTTDEIPYYESLSIIARDPFEEGSYKEFFSNMGKEKYRYKFIKDVLLEQDVISGIGNIYASEILHDVGIRPEKYVGKLTHEELDQIFRSTQKILDLSIQLGGTSISDYVDGEGNRGSFQNYLKVYRQDNCPKCADKIQRVLLKGNRATYYCEKCQKF